MTIASAVSKATLNGNGSTTSFPFSFKVWKSTDLEVSITDASGNVTTTTSWSVVLNPSGGGTVTYPLTGSPLPSGHKITIARSMDFLQDVDLVSGTRFDPEVIETALDKKAAELQQLKECLDRSVTIPISSATTPEAFADSLFDARDQAVASASSAATSAATAQVAANSVGVLSASGTLTTGQDTITLPWAYDVATGNIAVFLGGVKQLRNTLTFVDSTHVKIGAAVTENTPYEVTSVTLSAESVLTGLRDQCATAKTGAETARTGAETAQSGAQTAKMQAESARDTVLAALVPASEIAPGIAKLATTPEAQAGTDDSSIITPKKLRDGLNAAGTAPIYACRAWVNFNGTGTVTIRASGNVSSITDNGTGDYTVNFATAMQDANYVAIGTPGGTAEAWLLRLLDDFTPRTPSLFRFQSLNRATGSLLDNAQLNIAIFR